jgi:hypothetical protein
MNLKIQIDNQQILQKLGKMRDIGNQAIPPIYNEFVKNTPIDRGNARRNTKLQGKKITADYAYAGVLEAGRGYRDGQMRGSTQAPQGMTKPTLAFARKLLKQLAQKAGR